MDGSAASQRLHRCLSRSAGRASSENAASREDEMVCVNGESSAAMARDQRLDSPSSEAEVLRLVLLGRTGSGRSSSGNTILGRPAFRVDLSPSSVTSRCARQSGSVTGRGVSVIDTPGFFHSQLPPEELMAEVGRCVELSSPGPHAFVVTLRPGRFTREERDTLECIRAMFGPGAGRFTVVLFTCGDQLQGKDIKDFLEESRHLSEFVNSCHGGYHVFDNSGQEKTTAHEQQVVQLLEKVDKIVADNGGGRYSNGMFREAERAIREAQERIVKEMAEVKDEGPELGSGSRREEEEARKKAERLFWSELVTAVGRGAAEGAGVTVRDRCKGEGRTLSTAKVVRKASALATSPLSISSVAKAVRGAVLEGSMVFYKHRETLLR